MKKKGLLIGRDISFTLVGVKVKNLRLIAMDTEIILRGNAKVYDLNDVDNYRTLSSNIPTGLLPPTFLHQKL